MYLRSMTHSEGILRCLALAQKAGGYVHPNPWVGALIVHEGRVLGEGYHHKAGQAHAEVEALRALAPEDRALLPHATMYVNLEPCAHRGKTPPCADALVEAGIGEVVVGTEDPNPLVSGQGIARLREAGIHVTFGIEEAACRWLNRRFFHAITTGMPYLVLKWAESADGFIDGIRSIEHPGPYRISNEASRTYVHQWRSEEAGILVGWGTYVADEPALTVREVSGAQPQRILWSTRGTWDVEEGWKIWAAKRHPKPWEAFQRFARESGLRSIFIEGGAATLQSLLDHGLWNEVRILRSPIELGRGVPAPKMPASAILSRAENRPEGIQPLPDAIGDNAVDVYLPSILES